MKKHILPVLIVAASAVSTVNAAEIFSETSKTGYRTVKVEFVEPVNSVRVFLAAEKTLGGCLQPNTRVHGMNRIGNGSHTSTTNVGGNANAGNGKYGAGANVSRQESTTQHFNKHYQFGFRDYSLRNVKYNIVYKRNGKETSLGWYPDSGGGCTYDVSPYLK